MQRDLVHPRSGGEQDEGLAPGQGEEPHLVSGHVLAELAVRSRNGHGEVVGEDER